MNLSLILDKQFGVMFCVESVYNFVCVFVESKHRVANISDTGMASPLITPA